jgi:hypothetical protein
MTEQFKTYEVKTRATVFRTYRIEALTEDEAEDHYPMGELLDEGLDFETVEDITQIEDE